VVLSVLYGECKAELYK